jgi:hypothetical protein
VALQVYSNNLQSVENRRRCPARAVDPAVHGCSDSSVANRRRCPTRAVDPAVHGCSDSGRYRLGCFDADIHRSRYPNAAAVGSRTSQVDLPVRYVHSRRYC